MSDDRLPAIPGQDRPAPADVSYEVELGDPEPPAVPPAVDLVPAQGTRLPVIPVNLQTIEGVKTTARRHAGKAGHEVAWHGLRSPWYLLQALFWALVGVVKLLGRWVRWWTMPVPAAIHVDAAQEGHRAWRSVHVEHKKTAKIRAYISLAVGGPVLLTVVLVWELAPRWWLLAPLPLLIPLLAHHGRPKDKPILHPATVTPRFRRLSADVVLRAYKAAGLHDPDKTDRQVTFGSTMARDGEGSRVVIDLPHGLGLDDAVTARPKIASGLDVQVSQVFLHRDPTSHRRHTLWVADRDPLALPVGKTPLLAGRPTDIWKRAPLGLDERGSLVTVEMMWNSFLFGGMPRQGKTWSMRLLALFAALDPFVQLSVFDASGKPDWRKFALVAESCAFGLTPTRDGKPPEILRDSLVTIKNDVEDRYTRLSALPTSVCPQGKLTREIARDLRFGMPVRVVIMDEVQEYFLLGSISGEVAELAVYLAKVAPGAGVIMMDGTQRPSGIGTGGIGTQWVNFRDQHQVRFALRTPSWKVSDLVLGDGSYSAGLDSSTLLPDYKGVGILRGAMDRSPTVRCYTADDQAAERILLAARALRERAGTLTGYAAGQEVQKPSRDVLADVLAVFGNDPGLHWPLLAVRLAKRFPERWAEATADSVSAECRAQGVPVRQVKMFGQNLNGCRKADIEQIAAGR